MSRLRVRSDRSLICSTVRTPQCQPVPTNRARLRARFSKQRVPHRWALVAFVLMAGPTILAACSSGQSSSSGTPVSKHFRSQVALFGDSLAWEAEPYWTGLIHKDNEAALTYDTIGGTATCDWLGRMREVESEYHPMAVELSFSGNNLTPCMKGYERYTQAYYDKYRADTLAAISIFDNGRTHAYLVGAPIMKQQESVPNWQMLNMVYAAIAQANPARVTYVVRSSDGIHFCPAKEGDVAGVVSGCPVYSSGAFRFAKAMGAPLASAAG